MPNTPLAAVREYTPKVCRVAAQNLNMTMLFATKRKEKSSLPETVTAVAE